MPDKILLLHGALGSARQMKPLEHLLATAKTLSKSAHHISTFDFSGHGADTYSGPLSMELFGRNILRHMDDLGWKQCAVFGYSMGGYAALQLAAQHPGRISAIVTLGSKWDWSPEQAKRETAMLQPCIILEKVPRYAASLNKVHTGTGWKSVMERTAALLNDLGTQGGFSAALAAKVDIPVHILLGDGDKMVGEEESWNMASALPKGSFKLLPDTGHPFEQVDVEMLAGEIRACLV